MRNKDNKEFINAELIMQNLKTPIWECFKLNLILMRKFNLVLDICMSISFGIHSKEICE